MHFLVLLSAFVACAAGVPTNTAKSTQDGRIEGGNLTSIEVHPHQVAVIYYGTLSCGGSIISPTCIVTAAHCVEGRDPKDFKVRAGSTYHQSGGIIHFGTGGFYHESYNNSNMDYDVAVLFVDPPFNYSDSVQNIALEDSEMYPGTSVVVTGWGSTWPGLPSYYNLQEAVVQIRDDATCNVTYPGAFTDRMICAASDSGFMGPCDGDDGGPLTTLSYPRKLVGVVSWKRQCGNPSFPAVYTKVSAVRDWILQLCSAQTILKGITKAAAIP